MADPVTTPAASAPDPEARLGLPIPKQTREQARAHCLNMGLAGEQADECVLAVATHLENGSMAAAKAQARQFLDLTGTYRLIAVLLAGTAPSNSS